MDYRIGFPVDGGKPSFSFLVLVKLKLAMEHSCVGGQVSHLRENSGAAFVFERTLPITREQYRFEFTQVPFISESVSPENLAYQGYSDSAACALAVAQYQKNIEKEGPLVLVSCAFRPQEIAEGLSGLLLEQVTRGEQQAISSLTNKWHVAQENKALALVLHHKDAEILAREVGQKVVHLNKNTFRNLKTNQTIIVGCAPEDLTLLAESLDIPSKVFRNIDRKHTAKHTTKKLSIKSTIILLISLYFLFEIINRPRLDIEIDWSKIQHVTENLEKHNLEVKEIKIIPEGGYFIKIQVRSDITEVIYINENGLILPYHGRKKLLEKGEHQIVIPFYEHYGSRITSVCFFDQKLELRKGYGTYLPPDWYHYMKALRETKHLIIDKKYSAVFIKLP